MYWKRPGGPHSGGFSHCSWRGKVIGMNVVTVPGLIHRFEDKVHQFERYQFGESTGKEPYYPMIVSFLGEESMEGYREIAQHLYDIWPSYKNEFLFLGVTEGSCGLDFSELCLVEDEVETKAIESEEIGNRVSTLFGLKSHLTAGHSNPST